MFEWLLDYAVRVLTHMANIPFSHGGNFYVVYLLTFVALAYLSFRRYHRASQPNFFKFLFPKGIYLHRSARLDYGIYFVNMWISPLILMAVIGLQAALAIRISNFLIGLNGGDAVLVGAWSATTYAAFIVGFTLVGDLSVYLIHRLHHWSGVLWPIHALHHSAEVMTPVTLYRKHPLWNLSATALTQAFTGVFQGLFLFVFYGSPGFTILFGLNTVHVIYKFFGANLRHSHVWLSWGKPLSYVFISPAMHQIHHDPTRMNRNYGEIFAIWDWLFGTLYIPEKRETFAIGLGAGVVQPHATLVQAYVVPIVEVLAAVRTRLTRRRGGSVVAGASRAHSRNRSVPASRR